MSSFFWTMLPMGVSLYAHTMAGLGKGSSQVAVNFPPTAGKIFDTVTDRSAALRWSRSKYALAVFEWWAHHGFPAVNSQDQAMLLAARMAQNKK